MQDRCVTRCGEAPLVMMLLLLLMGLRGAASLPAQARPSAFVQPGAGAPMVGGLRRIPLIWGEEDTAAVHDALRGRLPRLSFPGPDRYRRGIEGANTASRDRTHARWEGLPPPRISARHVDGFFTHRYSKLLGEEAARHALRALLSGPRRDEFADDGSQRRQPLRREALDIWDKGEDASEGGEERQHQDGRPRHTGRSKLPQQQPRPRAQPRPQYLRGARLEQEEFMTPLQY